MCSGREVEGTFTSCAVVGRWRVPSCVVVGRCRLPS